MRRVLPKKPRLDDEMKGQYAWKLGHFRQRVWLNLSEISPPGKEHPQCSSEWRAPGQCGDKFLKRNYLQIPVCKNEPINLILLSSETSRTAHCRDILAQNNG